MSQPIQVLDPLWIHVIAGTEYYPVSLGTLVAYIIHNLAQDMREQAIIPLARGWINGAVERGLVDRFGINDMPYATPSVLSCLSNPARTYHAFVFIRSIKGTGTTDVHLALTTNWQIPRTYFWVS